MRIVHEAVNPELAEVFGRRNRVVDRNQVGAHVKSVLDPAEGGREGSAAVGDGHTQRGEPLEHATKNEGTQSATRFGRHSHKPRQPVALHVVAAHHVPGMHKKCESAPRHLFKNGKKRRIVEVALVDVGSDLHAAQAQTLKAVEFA